MTSTPPQRYQLRSPHAPRWGPQLDQPVIVPITPRKPSARQNKASSDQEHTPPRAARQNPQSSSNLELAAGLQTPPTTRRRPQRFRTTLAPPTPSSAQTSPSKKRMSPRQSRNSYLDSESMQIDHANPPQITHTETASILPTPSKTPQKRQSEYLNASSTSRQLFGANEVQETDSIFPTPKRSPRKVNRKSQASHLALTLDSFEEELDHHTQSEEPKIEVFTDMRDKQPEKDASLDNPFYIDPTKAQPIIRPGRARIEGLATVTPDEYGMTREDIDEGIDRELGITYVFRGKRIFKPFNESIPLSGARYNPPSLRERYARPGSHTGTPAEASEYIAPITRSSIKGRLLFADVHAKNAERQKRQAELEGGLSFMDDGVDIPTMIMQASSITDEEADTEVDEDEFHGSQHVKPIASRTTRAFTAGKGKGKGMSQRSEWDTTDDESHALPPRTSTPAKRSTLSAAAISLQPSLRAAKATNTRRAEISMLPGSSSISPAVPSTASTTSTTPAKQRISRQLRNTLLRDMEQKQESDFWSSPEGKKLNYARVHSSSEPATPSIEMAGPEDPFAMMSTPLPEDEDSPTKKYGTRSRDKDGQRVLDTFSPGKKRKDRDGSGELGTLVRTQKAVSKRVRMAESLEGGIDDLEAEVQG